MIISTRLSSKLIARFLLLSLVLATYFSSAHQALAAPSGITITPPTASIDLPADQTRYRFTVMLQNHEEQSVNLVMRAEDFGNLDDTGGVYFLGSEPNNRWDPHRLAEWMTISPQRVHLNPGEQEEVVVEIINDHRLSPGGHYGAIVASIEANQNNSNIAINQALSSLLFVNKVGGEEYRLNVQEVSPQTQWWGGVEDVEVAVQNTGNTHVIPRGSVTLADPLDQTISHGVINNNSSILMPGSEQDFDTTLTRLGMPLWPGEYTLVLAYRYDGQDEVVTVEHRYFSIGIVVTAGLILLIVGLIGFGIKQVAARRF